MTRRSARDHLSAATRAERGALADDLAALDAAAWATPSLCGRWTVEDVVAHLTSAAHLTPLRWLASIVGARFDADLHNARRLAEHRGATPAETLARFRAAVDRTTAPSGHAAAWLGEVVVHAQDVRRPLGIATTPSIGASTAVAEFFARRDFAVHSASAVRGLRLEATDGPFRAGDGPAVRGTTLALAMAMAGRTAYLDDLDGPGVATLRERTARS
ncbi:maleylpyruvate isomerase family mycothiol-dependent enzyme [Cellulomonas telluris]|uniref:maleylpyruvate isomerase family mycothiol-dependent enzyme n=1 Tax=Cellulomonas telluris TaxID=2306636 RepID=UPI0010A90A50|nr:maleylpyruvate isomerase family mycothiol-dependent enzyme [Cellulomonas telluris]